MPSFTLHLKVPSLAITHQNLFQTDCGEGEEKEGMDPERGVRKD